MSFGVQDASVSTIAATGNGLTVIVRSAVTAGQAPVGSLVVRRKVTMPVKFAAGVYVTVPGVAVWAVLLKVPPPLKMLHAPVDALPPTLAPLKVMADGVADWHTLSGPPVIAVAG